MKSLPTQLMLIALLCYQCSGQSPQQHLAYAVDASIAKMEVLSQRFEEMGNQLNTKVEEMGNQLNMKAEEMGTQMNIKFEEMGNQLNTKVEEMGNQLNMKVEEMGNQLNMKAEEMGTQMNIKFEELHDRMTTMEDIQRLEQSIQRCSSREQISDFQRLFSDNECTDGTHNCSTHASCENTILHFQCSCLPGFEGDGFACEDVDECGTASANRCHSQATCTNTAGNYTCSCIPGFSGDGFNCEDVNECSPGSIKCHSQAKCNNTEGGYTCACNPGFTGDGFNCETMPCAPPSKVIESLGCVIPVKTKMSWEAAKKNCKEGRGRLLEGITTQSELDQLKQHFSSFFPTSYVWIGMQLGKWIEKGNAIGSSSPLWGTGEQNSGHDCGLVHLHQTRPYLGDYTCPSSSYSLCQK